MVLYRIGEIVYKNNQNLIFESQGVGYSIIFPDHARVEAKQKMKLYLYEIRNDYTWSLYGFKDFKERLLFMDLINLNGIGPRVAFNILNQGWEKVASLIALGKVDHLIEIPYINPRIARIVVGELQDKWAKITNTQDAQKQVKNKNLLSEAKETLKMLGFKAAQIDSALTKVELNQDVESMIEEAIKFISQSGAQNEQLNA
ncbi:Holliday junction branch migration protein RuvA [Mycoplasmopsis fermentans]|uniref:Holliday junction branch migration protein RuvA n=1 Tax=Mycoplasmopsis fermentans TaxID=2115 RepID=UPI000F01AC3F|nr:Holliday junction branch migration protein RuvA [Mycoplasmopsis fermentans]RMX35811.1 ruvA, C-terminal domain protein [Mycoplasmopsis fermentans MF-I2]RMX35871.1 ruvA, C-terminal domain protein [Mycoplasmopsis fermentans MF-I1]